MEDAKTPKLNPTQKAKVENISKELVGILQKHSNTVEDIPLTRIALYNVYLKHEKDFELLQHAVIKKLIETMIRNNK